MRLPNKLLALLTLVFQTSYAAPKSPNGEYVVIVHGIYRTSAHMKPLADFLESQGYEVLNLDYPSTKYSLEYLIDLTANNINAQLRDKNRKIHFVGYSMGGLLVRGIVSKYRPEQLGRVVQIAPPNHGSEVANFWINNFLYKKIYGPAGQQLTTHYDWNGILGQVNYDLGIIAGNRTIDPISSFLIKKENDGKVSVESTKLTGMSDHIVIAATHTFFPQNKQAQKEVLNFLKEGKFSANLNELSNEEIK